MKDIEAVKLGLASQNQRQQIAAMSEALNCGQAGLELVIQMLQHDAWWLQHHAFLLLRKKPFRSMPQVKRALRHYLKADSQYPEERQEVRKLLSNSRPFVDGVINPALLSLMQWGEVIVDDEYATGYRDEGLSLYIVDCQGSQKILKALESPHDHAREIDTKFLNKKGYSYYLEELRPVLQDYDCLIIYLPTFHQQEMLVYSRVFRGNVAKEVQAMYLKLYEDTTRESEEEDIDKFSDIPLLDIYTKPKADSEVNRDRVGELIKDQEDILIFSEQGSFEKLSRIKNFYQIPKKYLKMRGYLYYWQMSQTYQLPLIGYLSPKEYLNFLNFQILDFLSLKPIWSCF